MRWRLGIAAAAVLAVAGGLVLTFASGSGSQSQVTLDGVTAQDLVDFGVTLTPPDGEPGIDESTAEELAVSNAGPSAGPNAEVKQTVLVHLAKEGNIPPIDQLAWAVNFDPATIVAAPPYGFGLDGPPDDLAVLCDHPLYFVSFIDARTGEFIFATERSAAASADECS